MQQLTTRHRIQIPRDYARRGPVHTQTKWQRVGTRASKSPGHRQ